MFSSLTAGLGKSKPAESKTDEVQSGANAAAQDPLGAAKLDNAGNSTSAEASEPAPSLPYKPRERHRRIPSSQLSVAPVTSQDDAAPSPTIPQAAIATPPTLSVPSVNVVMPTSTLSLPTPAEEQRDPLADPQPATIRKRSRGFASLIGGSSQSLPEAAPAIAAEASASTGLYRTVTSRLQLQSLKAAGQRIGLSNESMGMQMLDTLFEKAYAYRAHMDQGGFSGVAADWVDIVRCLTRGKAVLMLPTSQASSLPITPQIMRDHVVLHDAGIVVTLSGLVGRRRSDDKEIVIQSCLSADAPVMQALRDAKARSDILSSFRPMPESGTAFVCGDTSSTLPLPAFPFEPLEKTKSSGNRSRSGSGASISSLTAVVSNVASSASSSRLNPFTTMFGGGGSNSSGSPQKKALPSLEAEEPETPQETFAIPPWPIDRPVKYNDVSKQVLKSVRSCAQERLSGLPEKHVERVTRFILASHPARVESTLVPKALTDARVSYESLAATSASLQAIFESLYDEFYAYYFQLHNKDDELAESHAIAATDRVEALVTAVLFDTLFRPYGADDSKHDSALASRVAALNMLDLSLAHLGIAVDAADEPAVHQMLEEIGQTLESLNGVTPPKQKTDILIKAHKLVIDGLKALPNVRLAPVNTPVEESPEPPVESADEDVSSAVSEAMQQSLVEEPVRKNSRKTRFNAGAGGADLLLPIMIFAVVKANPHRIVSHLLYIQRYRAAVCQSGEASYAIVNMTAVVEFLERVDLAALGLASDEVLEDLPLSGLSLYDDKDVDTVSIITASTKLRDRVSQVGELAGSAADSANKVLSGIVDSSWSSLRGLLAPNLALDPPTTTENRRPPLPARKSSGFSIASMSASVATLAAGGSRERPRASSYSADREMKTIANGSPAEEEPASEGEDAPIEDLAPLAGRKSIGDRIASLPGLGKLASGSSTPTPDDTSSIQSQASYLPHLTKDRNAAYARQPMSPMSTPPVLSPPTAAKSLEPVTSPGESVPAEETEEPNAKQAVVPAPEISPEQSQASPTTRPLAVYVPASEQSETDLGFMRLALEQAEEALAAREVPVGCVFVKDGQVIAKARNRTNEWHNATLHAELAAIDLFIHTEPRPFKDITLYVTVEPCIMCASALRQLGIGRVVYGCGNDRFGGCGSILDINTNGKLGSHPPYEASGGYYREEAIMVLRRFYLTHNVNAPKPKDKSKRVLKTEFQPIPGAGASE